MCTVCCAPLTDATALLCSHCMVTAPESVPRYRPGRREHVGPIPDHPDTEQLTELGRDLYDRLDRGEHVRFREIEDLADAVTGQDVLTEHRHAAYIRDVHAEDGVTNYRAECICGWISEYTCPSRADAARYAGRHLIHE